MNYPGGIRPKTAAEGNALAHRNARKKGGKIAAGNRGMDFEADINASNDYYREKELCLVTKRPTPINIVKVDYTHGPIITNAYFQTQSTTDYNGVYKGRYIDFEAKSTHSKTSFSLANIPIQQIEHLERVIFHGGIAFFLIHWATLKKTFLVEAKDVIAFYRERARASISLSWMEEKGHLVKEGYRPRYDYLPLVEEIFFPSLH